MEMSELVERIAEQRAFDDVLQEWGRQQVTRTELQRVAVSDLPGREGTKGFLRQEQKPPSTRIPAMSSYTY